ncbi:hypothetical protein CI102_2543 [Trichoderma harzianum]|nr:hypothetical protein CI102_2543 [Trichoderma harzianum]
MKAKQGSGACVNRLRVHTGWKKRSHGKPSFGACCSVGLRHPCKSLVTGLDGLHLMVCDWPADAVMVVPSRVDHALNFFFCLLTPTLVVTFVFPFTLREQITGLRLADPAVQ